MASQLAARALGCRVHFTSDFALARYTPNGTLDSNFGSGGTLVTDVGNSSSDGVNALAIYPNGKIVAAGSSDAHGTPDFALIRYLGG